jgi:catechol 2,3-dioxygenase-like lactoylglutathione lyase family enzyme
MSDLIVRRREKLEHSVQQMKLAADVSLRRQDGRRTPIAQEGGDHMAGFATLIMVTIDCSDPARLARFYADITGWEVTHSDDQYAMISDGTSSIGFGRIEAHAPVGWPDESSPKHFHLDFYVDDLDKAEAQCLELGATKPAGQPNPERWRVLLDPSGHPFDICLRP